jgi:hypothetical protein
LRPSILENGGKTKMRKPVLIILLSALLLAPCVVYAESMGDVWKQMDNNYKYGMVSGFQDGFAQGVNMSQSGSEHVVPPAVQEARDTIKKMDVKIIVNALDQFYANYANCNIPIAFAIFHTVSAVNGSEETELQKNLEDMRKEMAERIKNK